MSISTKNTVFACFNIHITISALADHIDPASLISALALQFPLTQANGMPGRRSFGGAPQIPYPKPPGRGLANQVHEMLPPQRYNSAICLNEEGQSHYWKVSLFQGPCLEQELLQGCFLDLCYCFVVPQDFCLQ